MKVAVVFVGLAVTAMTSAIQAQSAKLVFSSDCSSPRTDMDV